MTTVLDSKGIAHELDESDLDTRFTEFYNSGERIEVEWLDGWEDYSGYGLLTNGTKARFYVGKSTGWKPQYIQLHKSFRN